MSEAGPAGWPAGRRVAVSLIVMLEGYADDSPSAIGPVANPLKPGFIDLQAQSWALYGPKVGAWRRLDLFARADATALFYTSGILAERYPDLVAAIARQGHALGAHAYAQNTIPVYQSREQEKSDLALCMNLIEHAGGRPARGWLSPRCTPSAHTTELCAEAGMLYHADFFDADLPRMVTTPAGPIVGMPFTTDINDLPMTVRYGNEAGQFSRTLRRILGNWERIGSPSMCLDITVHAHVFGRPAGLIELAECIDIVREHEFCWLTHHEEIAQACATQG